MYCTVLYCTVLYCTVLYCTLLYCTVLYCIVLYFIVLYCIVLYCTLLYCTVLYCTVLYCTVLYCTALYCTWSSSNAHERGTSVSHDRTYISKIHIDKPRPALIKIKMKDQMSKISTVQFQKIESNIWVENVVKNIEEFDTECRGTKKCEKK